MNEEFECYDSQGMLGILKRFPEQCRTALGIGARFQIPEGLKTGIDEIIVLGMGGSGITGDLIKRFAIRPVSVCRNYQLPEFADDHTLLLAVSYSGNTEETLSALQDGLQRGGQVICISSGGELQRICEREGLPFIKIPAGLQPRAALGYLSLPLLWVCTQLGMTSIPADALEQLVETLEQMAGELGPSVPNAENPAKSLAKELLGQVPLIYGTADNTDVVAQRWKAQLNENSKQPAFWNFLPELNHNEITGLTLMEKLMPNATVILLCNDYDFDRNRRRIEIMKSILYDHGIPLQQIQAEGDSEVAQIYSQIYLGDFVSVYLAILNEIDPTPVEIIEAFKREMAQRS
ncbi:MAG: bifunctional phosphoglucose/phosphomannose isomerase [Candidatus Bipolaricaulia bacterium]